MKPFFQQTKLEKYIKTILIIVLVCAIGYKFIERMSAFIQFGQ